MMWTVNARDDAADGLTVVELLVALSVAAVLALLALTASRKVGNQAKAVTNVSNLRQIAAGLIGYANDHDSRLPYNSIRGPDGSGYQTFYTRQLAQTGYVADGTIFFSPWGEKWWTAPAARLAALRNPALDSSLPWSSPAYGANSEGAMPTSPSTTSAKNCAQLSQVGARGDLSKLMILRDVYNPNTADKGGGMIRFAGGSASAYIPKPEHRAGYRFIQAAFADGHVEIFTPEEIARFEEAATQPPYCNKVYTR